MITVPRAVTWALAVTLAVAGLALVAWGLLGPAAPPPAPASPAASGALSAISGPSSTVSGPSPTPVVAPPSSSAPASSTPLVASSPPVNVRIDRLGVESVVNPVGLNPDGTLQVPAPGPHYDQAAWYQASPTPGTPGPAVVLGHVDSAANGPSVFYRLGDLRPGNQVEITLADRTVTTFSVDAVQSFPKDAFPQRLVYGNVPRPELRLITCGGSFDRSARSYRDNVVVFAHLVAAT